MPKFGNTSTTNRPAGAKAPGFAGTGAGFLTQAALIGELIIAQPVEIVHGVYNEGKPDARPTKRLKCDVVVLTGPNRGEHPNMLLSGSPIINAGEEILNATPKGQAVETVLLGRMIRKPLKRYKDHWATPDALEKAIADPTQVVPGNCFSWLIPDASASDQTMATAYYEQGTLPEKDDEEEDAFAD
jgi:hypothetical protein